MPWLLYSLGKCSLDSGFGGPQSQSGCGCKYNSGSPGHNHYTHRAPFSILFLVFHSLHHFRITFNTLVFQTVHYFHDLLDTVTVNLVSC